MYEIESQLITAILGLGLTMAIPGAVFAQNGDQYPADQNSGGQYPDDQYSKPSPNVPMQNDENSDSVDQGQVDQGQQPYDRSYDQRSQQPYDRTYGQQGPSMDQQPMDRGPMDPGLSNGQRRQ